MTNTILQPVATLAAWTMFMWVWLYVARLPAMSRARIDGRTMVGSTGSGLRADLIAAGESRAQWKADNYNHLLEQPTVFYAVALSLALTDSGNGLDTALAWAYVVFRVLHSLVQVTVNRVIVRFALHAIGTLPLIWLTVRAVLSAFGHHVVGDIA